MIYLQTIGTNNRMLERMKFGKWSDNYGNKYLSSRGSYQKIRIDNSLVDEYDNGTSFDPAYFYDDAAAWTTPKGSIPIVSNKNMNLSLKKNRYKTTEDVDHHLVYVIIDRVDFKHSYRDKNAYNKVLHPSINLIDYECPFNIVQTFTTRDKNYIGCAISVNSLELSGEESTTIMTLYLYNESERKFQAVNIVYDSISKSIGNFNTFINSAKEFTLKQDRRVLGDNNTRTFTINERHEEFITAAYITKPEYTKTITESLEKMRNAVVKTVSADSDLEEETVSNIVNLTTGKDRYRAVTLVGYEDDEITDKMINAEGLLYLFNYDTTDKTLKCIKSL